MDPLFTPIVWQVLKIGGFMLAAIVGIKLLQRLLFPAKGEAAAEEVSAPDPSWTNGQAVTPDTLEAGVTYIRDDGILFVYMRKAEPQEYRDVEEWLFHPPGQKSDLWIGLTREDIASLRRPAEPA